MSYSSQSDRGCNLNSESSVASSYGIEAQECRKRPRQTQIQGSSWVVRGQITIKQLHAIPIQIGWRWARRAMLKITKINTRLQNIFGAQFEILFGKLIENVMYFVVFCNLINILDSGADSNDAVKINIEFRGFLQVRKPRAVTALQKLLSPFAPDLSGYWERCVGGLFGNHFKPGERNFKLPPCRAASSPWMPIQSRGEIGSSNKGRAANKSPQPAVIASLDVLSFVFRLN
jgi:hypothetical protein